MLLAVGCDLRAGWGLCFVGLLLVLGLLLWVCVGDSPCCFVCCSVVLVLQISCSVGVVFLWVGSLVVLC